MGNISDGIMCAPQCTEVRCKDGALPAAAVDFFNEPWCQCEQGKLPVDNLTNSRAMINHRLLKAARDGSISDLVAQLDKKAYLETRRPFLSTPDAELRGSRSVYQRGVGLTPLMYASQNGNHQCVVELLVRRAQVNATEEDGMTPLHFAASGGCMHSVNTLLEYGADPTLIDDNGMTAKDYVPPILVHSKAQKEEWRAVFARTWLPVPSAFYGKTYPYNQIETGTAHVLVEEPA